MCFFSFCFLLTQYTACQGAARASWSLREEEPGAEHNKADRGNGLTSKGSVPPQQHYLRVGPESESR